MKFCDTDIKPYNAFPPMLSTNGCGEHRHYYGEPVAWKSKPEEINEEGETTAEDTSAIINPFKGKNNEPGNP